MVTRIKAVDGPFIANKKNETYLLDIDERIQNSTASVVVSANQPVGGRTFQIDGELLAEFDSAVALSIAPSARRGDRLLVGSDGDIFATHTAVEVRNGDIDIRNQGRIASDKTAVDFSGNEARLRNAGDIVGGGSDVTVNLASTHALLQNSGTINAVTGRAISLLGETTVRNSGLIKADNISDGEAIFASGDVDLKNSGTITAKLGAAIGLSFTVDEARIVNSGTIFGQVASIRANLEPGDNGVVIINSGKMIGDIDLSLSQRDDLVDTAAGRVEGDILTGAGEDRINLTGAVVTGTVAGGLGDDVYTISTTTMTLVELANGGTDTLRATGNVSITAPAEIENIVLIGKNDTQAKGNTLDNVITGNVGNNVLSGDFGQDVLRGNGGRDVLTGGLGIDTFVFRSGGGKDVITDFDTRDFGPDLLDLSGVRGIADFDDLVGNHAIQSDADVVINAGKGDQIVLENVTLSELRADMFFL